MDEYVDTYGVIYRNDGKILFRCPQNFHGDYVIPEGTISIASNAFGSCTELVSIVIPASVEYMGDSAFNRCSALVSVLILSEHLEQIASSCFRYCSKLQEIHIPQNVKRIGPYAFSFSGLSSVILPDAVTDIEYGAFYMCANLSSVHIPSHRVKIAPFAFHGCNIPDADNTEVKHEEIELNDVPISPSVEVIQTPKDNQTPTKKDSLKLALKKEPPKSTTEALRDMLLGAISTNDSDNNRRKRTRTIRLGI